jgi:hypothetical protein
LITEPRHGRLTLVLPVSRAHLAAVRAAVGFLEVAVLSLAPALVIPALSPLAGQFYPWPQAFEFSVLWAAGGAFIFAIGFLASSIFAGEYTAPVAAFLGLLLCSAIADLPSLERYSLDIHDIMSGIGMPYFQANGALLIGPLPWAALAVIVLTVVSLLALAGQFTRRQDF